MRYRVLLAAACLLVLGSGVSLVAGPFTGSWEVEIGFSPQQTAVFSAFSLTLDVGFQLGFLELSSTSDFIFSGWLWQEFDLCAALGFVSFEGAMLFEPQTGSFLYAQGILAFDFSPVIIRFYSAIVGPEAPGGMNWGSVFDLYGEILGGDISVESATFFGADLGGISFTQTSSQATAKLLTKTYTTDPTIDPAWCVGFSGEEVTFKACAFACLELVSVTTFSQIGFVSQEFELSFLHLFGIPLDITLDYVFSLQTASHTFTPSLETDFGCLKVYTDVLVSGGVIEGVAIYGIAFEISVAGSTFRSISNLNTTDCVITTPEYGSIVEKKSEADSEEHLYYPQDYWEVVSLVTEVPAGGSSFTFSLDTFFGTTTGLLFDWAMSEMGVEVGVGGFFSVETSVVVDTTGFTEWAIGITIAW